MKKIFTLFAVILMAVCASAQDLTGYYISTYSWVDAWGDTAGPKTAVVSIKMDEDGNVLMGNFANMGGTVAGVYDAATQTITFSGQELSGYTLCTYPYLDTEVVATVSDNVISFAKVGIGYQGSSDIDWYYRELSSSMKKLNPTASVPASYILGEGANIKGESTVHFYSIDECDYDFGFELAGQLVLVYNDGEDLEILGDVIDGINPAEEYSKLELYASNWWGDKFWSLSGDNSNGALTLKGEYYTESGFFADPVEEATFTLTWGGVDAISAVKGNCAADVLYNLAGQRVVNGAKGIMIQNGRKFIAK